MLLVRYCAAVGATPFTINPHSLQFEELRGSWGAALLTTVFTAYLCVTEVLVFRGTIATASVAQSVLHFQFVIVLLIADGLHLFLFTNATALTYVLNRFVRFWAEFEGNTLALIITWTPPSSSFMSHRSPRNGTEPVSHKERVLQATIVYMLPGNPTVCLFVFLADPFATRYPTWLVARLGLSSEALHVLLSALSPLDTRLHRAPFPPGHLLHPLRSQDGTVARPAQGHAPHHGPYRSEGAALLP